MYVEQTKNLNKIHDGPMFHFDNCYSHFGIQFNDKYNSYSIPINITEELHDELKDFETKLFKHIEKPEDELFLRSVYTKTCHSNGKTYRTLYLPLMLDDFDFEFVNEKKVRVSGTFSCYAVHRSLKSKMFPKPKFQVCGIKMTKL